MATRTKQERSSAQATLVKLLEPGDVLFTNVAHVSRSGMQRHIQVFRVRDDEPWNISGLVARACDDRLSTMTLAVVVNGAGMDMGFSVVYNLGRVLWPDGFDCVGEGCPSNDHSNGLRDYTPGAHHHADGGYALKHRWLS